MTKETEEHGLIGNGKQLIFIYMIVIHCQKDLSTKPLVMFFGGHFVTRSENSSSPRPWGFPKVGKLVLSSDHYISMCLCSICYVSSFGWFSSIWTSWLRTSILAVSISKTLDSPFVNQLGRARISACVVPTFLTSPIKAYTVRGFVLFSGGQLCTFIHKFWMTFHISPTFILPMGIVNAVNYFFHI